MANIKLDRPGDSDLSSGLKNYLNKLIDQLEYVLENIDEENITDSYKKKIEKEKK